MGKINIKSLLTSQKSRIVSLVIIGFLVGFILRGGLKAPSPSGVYSQVEHTDSVAETIWTCSMHPQIRQREPGKCPLCGMDLIPSDIGDVSERQITFSESAKKLMQIETSVVERKFVTIEIRMVGKIDFDETRVKNITAWVPGRIDRLYVDFTGTTVNKGDHLVDLYSPQLISAQAELIQASKAVENLRQGSSELIARSTRATLEAAREKLRLLGLSVEQVQNIESSGKADTHITIRSPIGGIVIEKKATEGTYVKTGTEIYTIADLSRLWVQLDAYESDLPWIRYGQQVEFSTQAHPGEIFKGTISFIDPVLNDKTRTFKLRVNVDNSESKLKPNMFVRAVVHSKTAGTGKVMSPEMAGKWICPMHPDVIKDKSGACDICGMALVTTESLGYVTVDTSAGAPLVIPASAPLITGVRAVVYVQVPNTEKPTYEGRQVVLGPRAGDYYIVKSGLSEGEVVVTNGNFKIDSALQIQAKPSMMNQQSLVPKTEAVASSSGQQTLCPVMGSAINKELFVEYKGKKVYFCCPGCIEKFEANPEKYLSKLPQFKK